MFSICVLEIVQYKSHLTKQFPKIPSDKTQNYFKKEKTTSFFAFLEKCFLVRNRLFFPLTFVYALVSFKIRKVFTQTFICKIFLWIIQVFFVHFAPFFTELKFSNIVHKSKVFAERKKPKNLFFRYLN